MFQEKLARDLIGEKLSSVTFVMDYLQLDFDGSGFTMFIWPAVVYEGEKSIVRETQYRNSLCSLIAKIVSRIEYTENVLLRIIFDDKNSIDWPINPDNPDIIAEIGIYENIEKEWLVFQ